MTEAGAGPTRNEDARLRCTEPSYLLTYLASERAIEILQKDVHLPSLYLQVTVTFYAYCSKPKNEE
eukprot:scaffold4772_cov145-Skeletonema_menzelii.AAC.2